MIHIAVHSRKMIRGVDRPIELGGKPQTFDWRARPGSDANTRRIVAGARVLPLEEAFSRRWPTDAHFVPYVLHGADGQPLPSQPRVNKGGLEWVEAQGITVRSRLLTADIDNPGHSAWNEALLDGMLEQMATLEAFRIGGTYFTAHGIRLFHQLNRGLAMPEFEAALDAWFDELEAQGLAPDRACRDWTRLYRLPWVRRADGARQEQTVDLERLTPRDPPATTGAVRARRRNAPTVVAGVDFAETLPPAWQSRAVLIGEAIGSVQTEWHTLFLALAGALCQRGVPGSIIPAIAAAVSAATGDDDRQGDRVLAARSTVQRFLAEEPIVGADQLLVGWPEVAAVLDQVTGQLEPSTRKALPPASEAAQLLERAISNAPDGVSVMAAGCGVGKTRATVAVAVRAASRGRTKGGRAPAGAKTVISEPTNAMARQVAETVRAQGGSALRVFSPASELDADGNPVCRYHESAMALARGRLSVPYELCAGRGEDPCPHRDQCPASMGRAGDEDALVIVGNHGMLSMLTAAAGTTGLRVIDEPPPLLSTVALTAVDFGAAWQHRHCFDPKYFDGVAPAVQAFSSLLTTMPADAEAMEVESLVSDAVLSSARSVDAHNGPRVARTHVRRAREQAAFAAELARASGATWALWYALTSRARWVARVEHRGGVPTLLLTGPNEDLVEALHAEGRTVLLDAAPDLSVLSKTVGYDLSKRCVAIAAADGAPIHRTHLHWSGGSRRTLLAEGKLQADRYASALRAVIAWAMEDPACRSLGLITLMPYRLVIDAVKKPEDKATLRAWRRSGRTEPQLAAAVEVLAPVLARWSGELLLGHYGAMRGLDSMKGVDAIATLADPWPHLGEVRNDVAYLGDGDDTADKRAEWLARAELEQAHGRLRAPHRTRPGRALHAGRLRPLGPGWDDGVETRRLAPGRPENEAAASVEELRAWIGRHARGSIRGAARMLGVDDKSIRRYLQGSRAIPTEVALLVQSAAETSVYREPIQRFRPQPITPRRPDVAAHSATAPITEVSAALGGVP